MSQSSSLITITMSLVMITLFSIAIIGFAISFGNDNNSVIRITNDSEMSSLYDSTKEGMKSFKDDSGQTYQSILDSTVEPGGDVFQSAAPFAITPGNLISVAENIFLIPYRTIFGKGSGFGIFFTTLIAFLVLIYGFLIYKALRGNP